MTSLFRRFPWLLLALIATLTGLIAAAAKSERLEDWRRTTFGTDPVLKSPTIVEVGPQEVGQLLEAKFVVANRGNSDLHLSEFRSGCACDSLEVLSGDKYVRLESLSLKPGASATLRVLQRVRGQVGQPYTDIIRFRTNDPALPEAEVAITVPVVTGGVVFVPSSLTLGTLETGSTCRHIVGLYDPSGEGHQVHRIVSEVPRVTAHFVPADPAATEMYDPKLGRLVGHLKVEVDTTVPSRLQGNIQIVLRDRLSTPDSLPVSGRVVAPAELFPPTVVLPRRTGRGPVYHFTCIVKGLRGLPVRVESVETSGPVVAIVDPPGTDTPTVPVRIEYKPILGITHSSQECVVHIIVRVGDNRVTLDLPVTVLSE